MNVKIYINGKMIKRYNDLGYNINKKGYYDIDINDLPINSHIKIKVKCDNCDTINEIKYYNYIINKEKNNNHYYCNNCKFERISETNLKKYGTISTLSVDEFKIKRQNTMLDKYNTIIPIQNDLIKQKIINTNIKKYGEKCTLLNNNIKQKTIEHNLQKFGVEHYSKTDEFKNKIMLNCLQKYGVEHYSKTDEFKNKINLSTINRNLLNNKLNIISIDNNFYKIKCEKEHEFLIERGLLKNRLKYNTIICTICNPINSFSRSGKELILIDFIKNNYEKEILFNNKSIISPYELDIYLPDLNLAFEFNGLYWHNELYKSNNYHKTKTDLCIQKGIQLIHIYEDDWNYKENIIKSMILNKLNKTENKIFARKCEVKEISDNNLVKYFLNNNHIQGNINSSVKIGLFYNNELISLMTFGKLRKPLNSKSTDNEYEMLRFCNKLNTNIIGGASKLFKYFLKQYNPNKVISYADRGYSNGNLYKQLGFELEHITEPNYYYIIDNNRKHRFGFRKDILVKQGFDSNKSEHEIMLERKIYRIYNSGNLKFIFYI